MTNDNFSTSPIDRGFRTGISSAMLLNSSTKSGPDRAAVCRHKFEGILDMHRVKTGSPTDLGGFLEALRTNRYLAMDFWEMAESLKRLGGGIPQEEIEGAVVQCVSGFARLDAADPDLRELRREFSARLGPDQNDGIAEQSGLQVMAGMTEPVDAAVGTVPIDGESASVESAENFYQPDSVRREQGPVPDSEWSSIVSRLEITSLELKLHLDDIDSRMSRMEPHLDELKRRSSLRPDEESGDFTRKIDGAPEPVRAARDSFTRARSLEQEDDFEGLDLTEVELKRPTGPVEVNRVAEMRKKWAGKIVFWLSVLRLAGELLGAELKSRWTESRFVESRAWDPKTWSSDTRRYAVLGGVAALLLSAGGLIAKEWVGLHGSQVLAPVIVSASRGVSSVDSDRASTAIPAELQKAKASSIVRAKGETGSGGSGVAKPWTKLYGNGYLGTGPAPVKQGSEAAPVAKPAAGIPMISDSAAAPVGGPRYGSIGAPILRVSTPVSASGKFSSSERTDGRSRPMASSAGVSVSSGVMTSNLVRSRAPDYPAFAKLAHVEGSVVLQVFIAKDGTVDRVNAIRGPHLLRGAAKNAVRSWRYRPYVQNGAPVEVGTIVTMDFALPR